MAITAPTKTTDFSGFLPAEISAPIFERAARQSVVMQLARQVRLGFNGVSVSVVTGRPAANWVAEGVAKPATKGTRALKTMAPKKLAAIVVDSMETVRADPGGYVSGMRNELAEAFAIAFDYASLHNLGGDGTGTGPFSTYIDQTTKVQEIGGTTQANGGVFIDLKEAMTDIVSDVDPTGRRFRLTGWAIDSVLEPVFWGQVDTTGRPIWVDIPQDQASGFLGEGVGNLLGRKAYIGEGVATPNLTSVVGYGGDWSQAAWGVVGTGIEYSISDQATVTINGALVSLWENNLVAIRAEAEYGFLVNDVDGFTKLTNIGNVPITSS